MRNRTPSRDPVSASSPSPHPSDLDSVAPRKRGAAAAPPGERPAKRERRDGTPPPRRRPVHETALAAWDALRERSPERPDFTVKDVLAVAEAEWALLRPPDRLLARWRKEIQRFIRRGGGMFRRADRASAPPDSLVIADRTFTASAMRRRAGDVAAAKRGDPATAPVADAVEDAASGEAIFVGASVPAEWTAKMYKPVRLSSFDKSGGISFVNQADNVVTGVKGFRTIRATTGVCSGDWYFEVSVLPSKNPKSAVRLGWSMRRCDVETPVGFDTHGYGIRDKTGEFVHIGYRRPYGEKFTTGDVIGCRIVLPELTEEEHKKVVDADERWLQWRFIAYKQGPSPTDSGIDLWPRGRVEFYKNGKCMGLPTLFKGLNGREEAVKLVEAASGKSSTQTGATGCKEKSNSKAGDKANMKVPAKEPTSNGNKKGIVAGYYYPSISLFKDGVAEANFGPVFKFAAPEGTRPMCEAAEDPPPEKPSESPAHPHQDGQKTLDQDAEMPSCKQGLDNGDETKVTSQAKESESSSPARSEKVLRSADGQEASFPKKTKIVVEGQEKAATSKGSEAEAAHPDSNRVQQHSTGPDAKPSPNANPEREHVRANKTDATGEVEPSLP